MDQHCVQIPRLFLSRLPHLFHASRRESRTTSRPHHRGHVPLQNEKCGSVKWNRECASLRGHLGVRGPIGSPRRFLRRTHQRHPTLLSCARYRLNYSLYRSGGGGINVSFAPYLRGNGTTLTSHRGTSHSSAHRRRARLDGDVQKAVDMGYTVLHMYKVWHFPESSMELYSNYINKWLQM